MAQRKRLKDALKEHCNLHDHVRNGMGAFAAKDYAVVAEDQRSRIGDSLDLDAAAGLEKEHKGANRWDYIVSIPELQALAGIEPHTAKDSEISVVLAKKNHAVEYLHRHFRDGYRVTKWFWVTHGTVGFSKMDRARRRLDQNGIAFTGRVVRLFG